MGEVILDLKDYQPEEASSSWLKLEEGTTVLRVLSHVYTFKSHYIQSEKKSYDCAGEVSLCEWCQKGHKAKSRWAYLFLVRDTGEVQALEMGWQIFEGLLTLAKDPDYGDNRNYDVKITRKGTGRDTSYTVIPGKDTKLSEKETALLKKLKVDNVDSATLYLVDLYTKPIEDSTDKE